jgi:hypothetical protein
MNDTRYTTNPETGRRIRVGGVTFNQLIFTTYDFINGELVRRATAPLPTPRQYYYNVETNRLIYGGSRRYYQYIRAGWDIEYDYYLIPPHAQLHHYQNIEQEVARHIRNAEQAEENETPTPNPTNYEEIMATHRDGMVALGITLCKECLSPIKIEQGEYCEECHP